MIWESWAEIGFVILLLVGLLISLSLHSTFLIYLTALLCGIAAGRFFYYKKRKEHFFPYMLIILGLLLGLFIGAISSSRILILILFFVGAIPSYYLHKKGYFTFFKSAGYIK